MKSIIPVVVLAGFIAACAPARKYIVVPEKGDTFKIVVNGVHLADINPDRSFTWYHTPEEVVAFLYRDDGGAHGALEKCQASLASTSTTTVASPLVRPPIVLSSSK